jgi:hypothetical protein
VRDVLGYAGAGHAAALIGDDVIDGLDLEGNLVDTAKRKGGLNKKSVTSAKDKQ